ncbi:hypothetical protein jhhlp_002100 [Lomentospora prolificans]|uniref:Autophagy-related protein 17 n=1 Tax=Lomentospora prolificans TaxID=41688 RepID=A0A2N3ND45_9PEZI|nr:hypothetical protein jhhlp_002100 [Lomentospora prolificans]
MMSSSSNRSSRSNTSSQHHFHPTPAQYHKAGAEADDMSDIPIETLVEHLLAAKRSLSTMTAVVRANEICTAALQAYEESVILTAETEYLRRGMENQLSLLARVKRGLNRTYDVGKKDFKDLIKQMDAVEANMAITTTLLQERVVQKEFREGENDDRERTLLDFVEENRVAAVVEALKGSVEELQSIQTSFDGDILRFETEIRNLKKTIAACSTDASSPSGSRQPISILLFSLTDHSQNMADLLSSLTKHFDLCVTAVRTTEGGAALARRRAAEATQPQDGPNVSISGVIAEQESHVSDLEPITSQDRADMIKVVLDDASEVEGVVREINERLVAMETEFSALEREAERIRRAYAGTHEAFRVLEDIGSKLVIYVVAESEFTTRWEEEKKAIFTKLAEMDELRIFYEDYANAYERLILEVDRRRTVEDRIQAIWRKARETVDRLVEEDSQHRNNFMQDVGEYLPTDIWPGMDANMKRWEVRPIALEGGSPERSTPALPPSVVEGAKTRLTRGSTRENPQKLLAEGRKVGSRPPERKDCHQEDPISIFITEIQEFDNVRGYALSGY